MNIYVFALVIVGCVYQTVGETTIPVTFVTEKNINGKLDETNYFHVRLCGGDLYNLHYAIVHINSPNRDWDELQGDFAKCDVREAANSDRIISQNNGINGHTPTFIFHYRKEYGDLVIKCTTPNTPGSLVYTLAMRWLDWRKPMTKEALRFVSTKAEMAARNDIGQNLRSQRTDHEIFVHELVSVYLTDEVRKVNTQDNEQLVLNYCFSHDAPGYINVAVTAVDQKSGFATYVCPGIDGPCGATLTPFADSSGASVNFVKALITDANNIGPVKVMVRGDGRFGTTNNYLLTASKFNPNTNTGSCKA